MDDVYHAGNTRSLLPHSEGYDFKTLPPRYVMLWCVEPCECPGVETTIADLRPWTSSLDEETRKLLTDTIFDWKTTDGIKRLGLDLQTRHPVLEEVDDELVLRFSCNNLLHGGDEMVQNVQN